MDRPRLFGGVQRIARFSWTAFYIAVVSVFSTAAASTWRYQGQGLATSRGWGIRNRRIYSMPCKSWTLSENVVLALRSGADSVEVDVEDESTDEDDYLAIEEEGEEKEQDEEPEDEESDDEYDEEEEEEEEGLEVDDTEIATSTEFDDPLTLPGGLQMGAFFGVMLLARRFDMFDPKVVRVARFLFISYLLLHQAFLVYVRILAKLNNDRTPVTMTNPLSGLVNAQLGQKDGGDMVKNLASQFLSTTLTVVEYDLRQAKTMNGSLLVNMCFMWLLHFKMGQTQPLFAQTMTGVLNLVYHPLFQVYVLGRNLERPFKTNSLRLPGDDLGAAAEETSADETTTDQATDEGALDDDDDDESDSDDDSDYESEYEMDVDDED